MKDFFISYNSADCNWAEWIAWTLEDAGYTVKFQHWDIRPGMDFAKEMEDAISQCKQTIAVLSQQYFNSTYALAEWRAIWANDVNGKERNLIPVRVEECDLKGFHKTRVYIDLVNKDRDQARQTLLDGISNIRPKPAEEPFFPSKRKKVLDKEPIFPHTFPPFWNVPFDRNPYFTGREEILVELREKMIANKAMALSQPHALCGLGGIGKTQTAVEYSYRFRNEYQAVLWITADSKDLLFLAFISLASVLNLPQQDAGDQQLIFDAVKQWLINNTNWLLIFDNADNPDLLKSYLPHNPDGHILLTSRAQVFDSLGRTKPIAVNKMTPDEAHDFLLKRTGQDCVSSNELESIKQLAAKLDYLPLALEQAAAYITRKNCLFENYLKSYNKRGLKLLEESTIDPDKYPRSVATTWLMSFEQVKKAFKAAADLFRVSMFFHPDSIPIEIITAGMNELGPNISKALADYDSDPVKLDELMEPLTKYSLIHRDMQSQTYDIHRLVQAVYRDMMNKDIQRHWAECAIRALNQAFPEVEFSTWNLCKRLLPHAQVCVEHVANFNFQFIEASILLNQAAEYLYYRARYSEAEPLFRRALNIFESQLGQDHPAVATSLNNLAALLKDQGKYTEAEALFLRALNIREAQFGTDHPLVATSLNNLAGLLKDQGKLDEAEPLLRRALDISEAQLGPDHPDVAASLNSLAVLLHHQGKHAEAEPLYRQALYIQEAQLGKDHPNVAFSLNNLAKLLQDQGKYAEAEPLCRRALDIRESQLGSDHPAVATSLNDLAGLLRDQGKYAEAEPLCRRALGIREAQLGSDHPAVATSLNDLVGLLRDQGNFMPAEPLYRRALNIFESQLGTDHPNVAISLNNLAGLLVDQGNYAAAEPLYRRALDISEAQLGPDHPNTELVRDNLESLLEGKKSSAQNKKK